MKKSERIQELFEDAFEPYKGKSVAEIQKELHIDSDAKNLNNVITNAIISNYCKRDELNAFMKECSCIVKTINLEWNNSLKESMSLKVFKYCDLVNQDWTTSDLYNYFSSNYFIFVVFKKDFADTFFEKIRVWKMPAEILNGDVKRVWENTKDLIQKGKVVNYIDSRGRFITYFPTSSETKYIHVRPHAQNSLDTLPLPVKDKTTGKTEFAKHSFWLNSAFIRKIVVEDKYYE